MAESGPWRNFYLTGAMELRNGVLPLPAVKTFTRDTVEVMTLEMIFDYLSIRVNGPKANGMEHAYNLDLTDSAGIEASFTLGNSVLNYDVGRENDDAEVTLQMSRSTLDDIVMGEMERPDDSTIVGVTLVPDTEEARQTFADLLDVMDTFEFWFHIVEP